MLLPATYLLPVRGSTEGLMTPLCTVNVPTNVPCLQEFGGFCKILWCAATILCLCETVTPDKRLRWSRGRVLAFGTQVRGFTPEKILSMPSFGGDVKPSVPCRSFTACKRPLNVTWKSAFRQNYRTFLSHSSTFCRWVLSRGDTRGDAWWRKLERLTQITE